MNKKDLAEEYAIKEYERLNDGDLIFVDNMCFAFDDIKEAFNAGCESVVENMPELEWKGMANFKYANTYIGMYNLDNFGIWLLRFNGVEIPLPTDCSLEDAKQAANEDYKQRIKQALGL